MRTVTVNKSALIETLTENRDSHRETFLRAQEIYRTRVIEELDRRLAEVRRGAPISLGFRLPEPVDYTEEYDAVLSALEWEVADEVELDEEEFRQLVLNQWRWASTFAANTQSYVADRI